MRTKILIVAIALFLLAIVGFVLDTYRDAGELKKIKPHFRGQYKPIAGLAGPEDITIHPQTGLAFISADDRRPALAGEPKPGAIYAYELHADTAQPVLLTQDFQNELHPHGISLFVGENGAISLFVVNHRRDGHFIEIFDYAENRLVHRESIGGELMTSPNDVAAIGPRSFYVTNDHGNTSALGRTLEDYLRLKKSYVLYFDGERFTKAAEGLAYANGINLSRDGKMVFVAASTGLKIHVYDREAATNALTRREEIFLGTGVDNIELDEAGNLWVAAHPQLLTFTKYAKDPTTLSPSQVLKITLAPNGEHRIDEVFLDAGEALSGSTVAAVFGKKLLIGSVFDEKFLVCAMNENR